MIEGFDIGKISAISWLIAILTLIVTAPRVAYLLRGRNAGRERSDR